MNSLLINLTMSGADPAANLACLEGQRCPIQQQGSRYICILYKEGVGGPNAAGRGGTAE